MTTPKGTTQEPSELEELRSKFRMELATGVMETNSAHYMYNCGEIEEEKWISELKSILDKRANEFMALINQQTTVAEERQLSRIYNLANDYACKDTTMIGSESIRGYHYFNALNKVTEELTGRHMGR